MVRSLSERSARDDRWTFEEGLPLANGRFGEAVRFGFAVMTWFFICIV